MKKIIISVIANVFLSACGNFSQSESLQSIEIARPEIENNKQSLTEEELNYTPAVTGVFMSGPGVNAAYKKFNMKTAANDEKKSIRFEFKEFIRNIDIKKLTGNKAIEIEWVFLAESQEAVDLYADTITPRVDKSNAEFDTIIFKQLKNCRSSSRLEVNGQSNYMVQGVCIYAPSILIPQEFKNKVFVNGKLVHEPREN